jgi:hypothetical protein
LSEAGVADRHAQGIDRDRLPRRLGAASLRQGLAGPGRPWRSLEVLDETGSTNADLPARAAAGEDIDGLVLVADVAAGSFRIRVITQGVTLSRHVDRKHNRINQNHKGRDSAAPPRPPSTTPPSSRSGGD